MQPSESASKPGPPQTIPHQFERRLRRIERTIPWLFVLIALLAVFLVITYLVVIFHIKR